MPLKHGYTKKSFGSNVKTLMHENYPQKQALAIAYSTMRKAGHKMSTGGMCKACGGSCKYADGGEVGDEGLRSSIKVAFNTPQSPSSSGSGGVPSTSDSGYSPDEAAKRQSMRKSYGYSKGGEIKGVHESPYDSEDKILLGESEAGKMVRRSDLHKENMQNAKDEHHRVYGEIKSMQNPKLKGLAKGGFIEPNPNLKGVHQTSDEEEESSQAGYHARNYTKMDRKGINDERLGREKQKAINEHENVLSDIKDLKPKLKGLSKGGPVNLHDGAAKSFMDKGESDVGSSTTALPHGLDEGGEVEKMDNELMDQCCEELLSGIEKKDKKEILESLKALILSCRGD